MKNKNNYVYYISVIITVILVLWGLVSPKTFEFAANTANNFIGTNLSWWYALIMTSFIIFVVWLGFFSPYKSLKLGPDDCKPEFSFISWFALLFSAGMGVGLVFYGTAEPLGYFVNPIGVEAGSYEAVDFAMQKSFLHWGLHPWANYAVLGLALAYFQFRKNQPGLISSIFIPLIGEDKAKGWIGHIIDIFAVVATIAGVTTSLGLGAYQIRSGLHKVFGIPETNLVIVLIVVIITVIFIGTAISGLEKGMSQLSNINVAISVAIMIVCLIVGPTIDIFNTLIEGVGKYFQNLIGNAFATGAYGEANWFKANTIFYWGWWISWAPFTGTFIARISKGRTIREFCAGVLLVPALFSFIWFAIFGRFGIDVFLSPGNVDVLNKAREVASNVPTALFNVLEHYPLSSVISVVVTILLVTFFTTSANSATFVLGMLTSNGDLNPSITKKFIWGILQSGVALALMLFTTNGLQMLQTMSIVGGLPFSIIMLFVMISTLKILKKENK